MKTLEPCLRASSELSCLLAFRLLFLQDDFAASRRRAERHGGGDLLPEARGHHAGHAGAGRAPVRKHGVPAHGGRHLSQRHGAGLPAGGAAAQEQLQEHSPSQRTSCVSAAPHTHIHTHALRAKDSTILFFNLLLFLLDLHPLLLLPQLPS